MAMTTVRRWGAISSSGDAVNFRVWAPKAKRVELLLGDPAQPRVLAMSEEEPMGRGVWTVSAAAADGTLYRFRLDREKDRSDPCSLWQPEGVKGPSAVVRPGDFQWADSAWKGIALKDHVFYELHVGTFTPEGTFEAIIPRLESLKSLGVTAIELMPVGQFSGGRNWGYDGVLPFATQNTYGGPLGLQKLIDAAHRVGVAVFLDVVYNHFGPEDNYLDEFGHYFTDAYKTPWGRAVNYDGAHSDFVREYVLDNARMWLEEFHLDGLRLDAVHAIYDFGAMHILSEVEGIAQIVAKAQGRKIHIIAESDLNDPRVVRSPEQGGYGVDAQWSDDFHHAIHAYLTEEHRGYYSDFGKAEQIASVLQKPFLYAGDFSAHRKRKHGGDPAGISGEHFVVCIQNHDQVGNRAVGDRLSTLLKVRAKGRLATCLLLFAPNIPLLFMGEEYGEKRNFPFFCSFAGNDLVEAVRKGRKAEFADFVEEGQKVPDPQSLVTFESARLSWSWPDGSAEQQTRKLHADLLKARREWPALQDYAHQRAKISETEFSKVVTLIRGEGDAVLYIVFNLSGNRVPVKSAEQMKPVWSSESSTYGGSRRENDPNDVLLAYECVVFTQQSSTH